MKEDKVRAIMGRLDEVFHQMMRRMNYKQARSMYDKLTGSQYMVLKRINDHGRITVSGMADDLNVSLSAVTALIDRMYRAGYVVRVRDEADRRLVWLELTDEGSGILSDCEEARRQVVDRYFTQLPEEDLQELLRIYEKLYEIVLRDNGDNLDEQGRERDE
ncbi:MAG: MarR family transcriptional regulator [Bacillota bacterium]